MSEHDHVPRDPPPSRASLASRAGIALIVFLAVAGLLLAYEHRVHIFTDNGVLIALLILCVGMHLFMHGGHGRQGGDGSEGGERR